jgi:hypothetical protein
MYHAQESHMQQTDILIIGGGIAGTATACCLALSGHEVTLLEQSELATEASGLNAGTIWATGWGHTPDLSSMLNMGNLEVFKTLQLDLGYDLEFRQGGSLHAIQTEEEYAFARQEVRELLDGRDARSIEPGLGPRTRVGSLSSWVSRIAIATVCSRAKRKGHNPCQILTFRWGKLAVRSKPRHGLVLFVVAIFTNKVDESLVRSKSYTLVLNHSFCITLWLWVISPRDTHAGSHRYAQAYADRFW